MKAVLTFVVVACMCAAAGAALAATRTVSASLTPQQVVTPKNKPWSVPPSLVHARATFKGTISSDNRKLAWQVAWTNMGKPTLVIADIHVGPPGRFGAISVRLCGPCRSGQKGAAKLKAGAARLLASGGTWITLITAEHPNGVVRGQIK